MRKIIVLAGLLTGAALLSGTSANAGWVGCECAKLGQAAVCVPGPVECLGMGGVCLLPCDYQAPKMHHRHHRHHMHKKKM